MKICFVSGFPPSKAVLNEYGFHVARELQADPLISLTILADEYSGTEHELPDFDVHRCWKENRLSSHARLLKAIRECKPDVVWFNLVFSSFGNKENPLAAFSGLTLPAMTRMAGFYTHVTLHHLMDHIDLNDAGVRNKALFRAAGNIATRMLLMANSVSVLLPAYRRTLTEKYRGEHIHYRAHGILSARPEFPDFSRRGNPEHRILAFGKWGTYKRLELLLEAFAIVAEANPNARLVIAGGDHPMTPGYVQSVAERFRHSRRIQFTGYLAEERISELFSSASMMVMPYSSATGSSGVAHLACEYGLPIACAGIPDFQEMATDEGLAIQFYETGNVESLAAAMNNLLSDPQKQMAMAEQNFSAALRMTMPQIMR